jgi:hypothetical protein
MGESFAVNNLGNLWMEMETLGLRYLIEFKICDITQARDYGALDVTDL